MGPLPKTFVDLICTIRKIKMCECHSHAIRPEMLVESAVSPPKKFCPNFACDVLQKNGGLLKLSHTLDQYDVEPLPGCSKKSIMRTSHCGKPVIIKVWNTRFFSTVQDVQLYHNNQEILHLVYVFIGCSAFVQHWTD